MADKKLEFIPFNALNEFLLTDYRLKLLQEVFASQGELNSEIQSELNRYVKKMVKVQGFRNSIQAPAAIKARSAVSVFERSAGFVAVIMSAWCELHSELAQRVAEFLTNRGWQVLPLETDRAKLPGFLTRWPENDTFEELDEAFTVAYPDDQTHEYDLNLMIAWVWGRLPVELVPELDEEEDQAEAED
jgi:hypothetical protein